MSSESARHAPPLTAPSLPDLPPARDDRLGRLHTRNLTTEDVSAVLQLRDQVLTQLPHPDLYVREPDEEQFVRTHIGTGDSLTRGETIGVFEGDQLVAYAMLGLPAPDDPDNLGRCFTSKITDPARAAHLTSCMVLPAYRGQRLQRMLLVARMALARAHERDFCVAMVSPRNHVSRHNLMREGLRIGWVGEIDGLRRQLLALSMSRRWSFNHQTLRLVHGLDWKRQRQLTQDGWWGINAYQRRPQGNTLVFARLALGA